MIKAPLVILINDADDYLLSTRNQFAATVTGVTAGSVNAEVNLRCDSGIDLTAVITTKSLQKTGIKEGSRTTAIVKAPHVILAVRRTS